MRGGIEGPSMLLEPKVEPQDDEPLSHRLQLCYRHGPYSQVIEHDGGEDGLRAPPSYSTHVGAPLAPTMHFHAIEGIAFQFAFSWWYKDFVDPDVDHSAK